MTIERIEEQAETIEATVSRDPANMQEAIQNLASLVAALCEKIKILYAESEEFHGRVNE